MILLNMFGINSEYNWYSWFVAFYIYCMIVMPFISKFIDRKPIVATIGFIIIAYVLEVAVHAIPIWSDNDWTQRLFDCLVCTPGMLLGYLFAHEGWFTKIQIPDKTPMHWFALTVMIVVMVFVLRSQIDSVLGFNLDFFYAPLFILVVLVVFNLYEMPILSKVLSALGDVSVYMWFFHALFFTLPIKAVYEPFINISDSLWIVTPWTIFLTFICSWGLSNIVGYLQKTIVKI